MRKLRLQLIGTLVLVALLPAIPALLSVNALFRRSLDTGLETVALEGSRSGLSAARELLSREKSQLQRDAHRGAALDTLRGARWEALGERERELLTAWERDPGQRRMLRPNLLELRPPARINLAGEEHLVMRLERSREPFWVARPLPESLVSQVESMQNSIQLLESVRRERGSVARSLLATFAVVYGVVLLLVMALGFLLASRLTRPLEHLAGGIERVSEGDWQTRVPPTRGEMGRIVARFNRMVEELEHQSEELVRLEKVAIWRNLARKLAHEIKNPLTPIQLAAQQMRDSYAGGDPQYRELVDEGAAIIEEEVQALRNLVQEFSQFARMPEPKLVLGDPLPCLEDVQGLYGEDRLRLEADEDLPEVWLDPDEVHRVLINLVNNAWAAQDEAGASEPVVLRAVDNGEGVRLEVEDKGAGVPDALKRTVFEPDYSTRSDGMGLGLSIVEETVKSHGSRITVSDAPGGGALFAFTLRVERPRPREGRS